VCRDRPRTVQNVPRRIVDAVPENVGDGTILRDPIDGSLVHIEEGTRYASAT
jgi:hypothetical protein